MSSSIGLVQLKQCAVRAVEPRMKPSNIAIELKVDSIKLQGDPERILQEFLNILDNAIKHSAPDSKIFISGYRLSKNIVIACRDQGVGISDTNLNF